MEIDVVGLIGQLGFPITVCIGAMFFIYKIYWANREDSANREERHYIMMAGFQQSLDGFKAILDKYDSKLNIIAQDVEEIKKELSEKQ